MGANEVERLVHTLAHATPPRPHGTQVNGKKILWAPYWNAFEDGGVLADMAHISLRPPTCKACAALDE
jgi:hypothetical protein